MFASKTPRDLNRDPLPWQCNLHPDERWPDSTVPTSCTRNPRPEFDHVQHNEPNPMLVAFRGTGHSASHFLWIAGSPASTEVVWGVAASIHAREVLSRLANLESRKNNG